MILRMYRSGRKLNAGLNWQFASAMSSYSTTLTWECMGESPVGLSRRKMTGLSTHQPNLIPKGGVWVCILL
jgi:hypothetical protein